MYTVTHNTAIMDVEGQEGKRVFIVLSGCTAISTPSSWRFDIPRIKEVEGEEELYQFVDDDAGIVVEFEHLDVRDDYPAVGELR